MATAADTEAPEPVESNAKILNRIIQEIRRLGASATRSIVTINYTQADALFTVSPDGRRIEVVAETSERFSYWKMSSLYRGWSQVSFGLGIQSASFCPRVQWETSFNPSARAGARLIRRVRISFTPQGEFPMIVQDSGYVKVAEKTHNRPYDLYKVKAIVDPLD